MSGDLVSVDTSGLDKLLYLFRKMTDQAPSAAASTVRMMAKDLVDKTKELASGRPGPDVITGAYRASIQVVSTEDTISGSTAEVGSDAPQLMRLEFGYVGTDSSGRHYHQPAFSHWRPALHYVEANSKKYGDNMMRFIK